MIQIEPGNQILGATVTGVDLRGTRGARLVCYCDWFQPAFHGVGLLVNGWEDRRLRRGMAEDAADSLYTCTKRHVPRRSC